MAKSSCIPRATAEKMKQAIRNGDINIKEMFDMPTSEERRAVFRQFTSDELAKDINAAFEKAMVSKQKNALQNFAKKWLDTNKIEKRHYDSMLKRIEGLDDLGVLNNTNADTYLSDLITDSMGIDMTVDEIKNIAEKAQNLETLYNKPTDDGLPPTEYWIARKKMDDYIASLTPAYNLRVLTSTVGRGNLLFSVKSPLTNVISNTVNGAIEGFTRRLRSGTAKGLNNDFALDYVKKVNDIYQKSGYDISRMDSIAEGQKRLGEETTTSQGEGAIRAIGRFYEDTVFKQLMGAPDVAASSIAFADSANLASTKFAQAQGLEGDNAKATALEIFKDAIKIRPETVAGEMVRAQAIADARYSTYTNKGGYGDFAMAIRRAINVASGDLRFGDQLMPFIKTPANVIQAGVDASGVGAFRGFFKLPEAIKEMKSGNGEPMKEVVNLFIRSGLGLTLATVLAHMFDPEDFVGDYDFLSQKERDLAKLKNAPFNSIKIGDKYVSLDYLGPIAAPFVGMMYARKYGENLPSALAQYGLGVGSQALRVPGLTEFPNLIENISNAVQNRDLGDISKDLSHEAIGYIHSRAIPAIVYDFAKGIDPVERQSNTALENIQARTPIARQGLPERINQQTGEPKQSEGFISTLMFGSRLKKADESVIVKEFEELSNAGFQPAMTDISRAGRAKSLKEQIGDEKFNEALTYFGGEYSERVLRRIDDLEYKKKTPEQRKKVLDEIRSEVLEKMLFKFGYRKKKAAAE